MKLSLNWIKEYVDIPKDMDLKKLAFDITMSTVEVEDVIVVADKFKNIVVGKILEIAPHPNADKLRVCRVDIGDSEQTIVCGGSNLKVGMSVVVSLPGAFVRWHGESELTEIKKSKLRGVESYGMICASEEVELDELFPAKEEAEIIDLSAFNVKAGENVASALGIDDVILEIDNKSMTNRPDLWGHYGMAREIATLYNLELKKINPFAIPQGVKELNVKVEAKDRCPRYVGLQIDNISVDVSPFDIRAKLWSVGIRPINTLVDISNYVMMAVGQPTHLFDKTQIKNGINVRLAKENEKIKLLNGQELELSSNDLVIADGDGAVALAGVMGGESDSVLPTTTSGILEIANFEARGIRKTSLKHDIRSDASTRYEKALDTQRCDLALSIAMEMFNELYPQNKVVAFVDEYENPTENKEIDVSYNWLDTRLGKHVSAEYVTHKLGLLGFATTIDGDNIHLVVPSWRSTGDVSINADIMEEIARVCGYENFEITPIKTEFTGGVNQLDKNLVRNIEEYLAYRCGLQEVMTYPWMHEKFAQSLFGTTEGMLTISTPPTLAERFVRNSVLPNLCQVVVKNEKDYDEFSIFEEAQVFTSEMLQSEYDESEKLPKQKNELGCAFALKTEKIEEISNLFLKVKGIFENMPRLTNMESFSLEKVEKPVWANDVMWCNIVLRGKVIGSVALLQRKCALECGIKNLAVILVSLDLDALEPFASRENKFAHLPKFPMTEFDISMLVDSSISWEEIKKCIFSKHNEFLVDATFVEEYRGKQIEEGRKSVTIRLLIGSLEKTLVAEEIEASAKSVIKTLSKNLNAEIRDK